MQEAVAVTNTIVDATGQETTERRLTQTMGHDAHMLITLRKSGVTQRELVVTLATRVLAHV